MNYITRFDGTDNEFLSNFYPSEIFIGYFPLDKPATEPNSYATCEHAFQTAKTHNVSEREGIRTTATPGASKRMGRRCTLRDDWEIIKDDIMLFCLRKKFEIPELRKRLLDTEDAVFVEGNMWHDCHFGVCSCEKCGGVGKNMLGRLLMRVRMEIRKKKEKENEDGS